MRYDHFVRTAKIQDYFLSEKHYQTAEERIPVETEAYQDHPRRKQMNLLIRRQDPFCRSGLESLLDSCHSQDLFSRLGKTVRTEM